MKDVYVIRIPKDQIDAVKQSNKFLLLLRLCRFQNQILFCHRAFLDYCFDYSPIGLRQKFNSVFFTCGILHEAMRVIPDLGKEFRHFPSFQKGFANFFKQTDVIFLKTKVLNKMRNSLVFHVDNDALQDEIECLDLSSYEFVAMHPGNRSEVYYPLADDIALNAFIATDETQPVETDSFYALFEKLIGVMTHFSHCGDELIQEYVKRKGWLLEEDTAFYANHKDDEDWASTIDD